jgi:hypothetical protein
MSRERTDFLSRWSRRKLDSRHQEPDAQPAEATTAAEAVPEPIPPADEEPGLTPEEIAALPKVEDLTPESDIRSFLRKGVPQLLRNAALRRMWSLDPAIRDYVSEAREYAYDWNVPGGVPGNGPLLPSDDVGEMLGRIFGDAPRIPDAAAGTAAAAQDQPTGTETLLGDTASGPLAADDQGAVQQREGFTPGEASEPEPCAESEMAPRQTLSQTPGPKAGHAAVPSSGPSAAARPPGRRHGGAIPV